MTFFTTFLTRRQWAGASLLLALCATACTEEKAVPKPQPKPVVPEVNAELRDYSAYTELVWNDEFDGGALDQTKWVYEQGGGGWGNNELQAYTTSNSSLVGGNLVIEARKQQSGNNEYTSARIITKGKQNFTFGRIDVRAKLPKGKGVWPAIWMLGSNIDQVGWPICGEIDIMELKGSQPNKILSTIHYGSSVAGRQFKSGPEQVLPSGNFSDEFHVFSVVRAKDQMQFYLDGVRYHTFTSSDASPYPFNNPFFLILNVAIGGNYDGNPDGSTVLPQQMVVDYARFYQYK